MPAEVKINGKSISFPTTPADLSLRQFFALRQSSNILDEISACTGISRNEIENFNDVKSLNTAIGLMNALAAMLKKGFDGVVLPKFVYIGLKRVPVPKELNLQPIGAYMSVHGLLADKANALNKAGKELDFTDEIPMTLAHYFYKYYAPDAMYSDEAAEAPEYLELIYNMPITQAVPIANFFFRRFPNLM